MELSIIIPIRDEEESIKPLYFELKDVLDSLALTYEIIFVENCSTDSSVIEIEAIKLIDKNSLGYDKSNFVSLCRKDNYNGKIVDVCELAKLIVRYGEEDEK